VRARQTRLLLAAVLAGLVATTMGTATGATPRRPQANSYATFTAPGALASSAGEPSIGVDWRSGVVFLQAGTETDTLVFDAAGTPSWSVVTSPYTGTFTADPIAVSDNGTGRIFVSQLDFAGSLMAYSDDDGSTWSPSQGSGLPAGADHQTVGVGPYPAEGGARGLTTYPHAVYYCSQDFYTALCARSDNGGITFGAGTPVYTTECANLHGHLRVGPDGTVYLPDRSCNGSQGVAVSRDSGTSWTISTVPGSHPGSYGDPSIAVGADNTAYFAYSDRDGRAMVAVTRDHATSWASPYDLGAQVGVVNSAFPAAVAGDGDRAAVAFLGTRTAGDAQDQYFGMDSTHTRYTGAAYHLYVATTYDRGRTWKTVDVTGKDPVQRGRVCLGGTVACGGPDRNLLDFMDATVDRQGRVLVGWPDGCTLACTTSDLVAANSYSARGTVTRQASGKGLFAKIR
jgi:hypothetical protein